MERIFKRVREELKKVKGLITPFRLILSVVAIISLFAFSTTYTINKEVYFNADMMWIVFMVVGIQLITQVSHIILTLKQGRILNMLVESNIQRDELLRFIAMEMKDVTKLGIFNQDAIVKIANNLEENK